jgi:hypothetical protein
MRMRRTGPGTNALRGNALQISPVASDVTAGAKRRRVEQPTARNRGPGGGGQTDQLGSIDGRCADHGPGCTL